MTKAEAEVISVLDDRQVRSAGNSSECYWCLPNKKVRPSYHVFIKTPNSLDFYVYSCETHKHCCFHTTWETVLLND